MNFDGMQEIARRAGSRWGGRNGYSAADMEQEAWVAMLRAGPRYDPASGTPEGAYLWRCIRNQVTDQLRRRYEPPIHRGLGNLSRLDPSNMEDTNMERGGGDINPDWSPLAARSDSNPEAEVAARRWAVQWVERLEQLTDGRWSRVVRAVIVEGESPERVARRARLPVRLVYSRVQYIRRRRMAGDPVLAELRAQLR